MNMEGRKYVVGIMYFFQKIESGVSKTEENSGELIYLLKQANGYMLPFVTI